MWRRLFYETRQSIFWYKYTNDSEKRFVSISHPEEWGIRFLETFAPFFGDTLLSHIPESSTHFFVRNMMTLFPYYSALYEKRYNETNVRIACGEQQMTFNVIQSLYFDCSCIVALWFLDLRAEIIWQNKV